MRYRARIGSREFSVEIVRRRGGRYTIRLDGRERVIERGGTGALMVLSVDGRTIETTVAREGLPAGKGRNEPTYDVMIGGRHYPVRIADPLRDAESDSGAPTLGPTEVRSVMPGRIVAVLVRQGQEIEAGQGLVVVEAMKMENEIPSPKTGRVTALAVRPGDAVDSGALLVTVE